MVSADNKKIHNLISFYVKNKIPYTATVTNGRIEVRAKTGSASTLSSRFPAKELNFIKQVKVHIIKNGLHTALRETLNEEYKNGVATYYDYNKNLQPGDFYSGNLYSIDLTAAYWITANDLGLLTPTTFANGLNPEIISKKSRLAAIGSLAKKVTVYEFDGNTERILSETIAETAWIWDLICYIVGRLLLDAAKNAGDDFLFFWVDGIYVKSKETAQAMKAFFLSWGYKSVIERLDSVSVTHSNILVTQSKKENGVKSVEKKRYPFQAVDVVELKTLYQNQTIDLNEFHEMAELARISAALSLINKYN